MISGLIDELNKSADEWNASNMFELARMCREAADTICELRDDLQRANAENAKLRDELDAAKHDLSLFSERIVELGAENDKLQNDADLLRAMWSQERTEKRCYMSENNRLRESLERAAGIIADICGECPASRYEWLSSDGCAEKCGTVTEEECWIAYLTGKRWDESGAEVDR